MDYANAQHFIDIPVRFSDLDAMGHVNNARYLTYFEEGRAFWFYDCIKLPRSSFEYPVIVARIEIDYLAPLSVGDTVRVFTRCTRMGAKSLDLSGSLYVLEKNICAAQYKAVLVWYDYDKQRSLPIPEEARSKIVVFEGL